MRLQQLGPYQIGRKLGRGGMGTVYEGVDLRTGETAAVKVLSALLSRDEGFRERFEAEIETLRKLRHPNIVRLLGFGEQDGLLFYVMELVPGTSLEDELQQGRRFEWREVSQIGVKVARALKHAHDNGVIHRDIKPANLLWSTDEDVKLSDFGIAKLFGSTGLTIDGGVLGTADYMSPEQADGRPVTHRSDLYSLGCVLYALLARRPPFRAKSIPEMLHLQRFAEPEPLKRLCSDVPDELAAIIGQLMAKDPEKRIPNAMILARRLEAMEHGLSLERSRKAAPVQEEAGDLVLRPLSPSVGSATVDPLALTRAETRAVEKPEEAPLSAGVPLSETLATDVSHDEQPAAVPRAATAIKPAPARFTAVADEEDEPQASYAEALATLVSPQTWGLIAALVVLGGLAWYLLQPPGADSLYAAIVAQAHDDEESLLAAEDEIKSFLEHYPNDPRAREVAGYREEIERQRLERRFDRRARRLEGAGGFSPVERAYAEAMQQARLDPYRGVVQLEALLALYGEKQKTGGTDDVSLCLELARKQLARLRAEAESATADDLASLRERLAEAERLKTDNPEKARAIWKAVVTLYENKPWAAEAVATARQRLEQQE